MRGVFRKVLISGEIEFEKCRTDNGDSCELRRLFGSPGRTFRPVAHRISSPGGGFIRVAGRARIGNLVFVCHRGRDEFERVRVNERACRTFGFNFRHVTGDALASCAALFVMSMFFDRGRARAVR